MNVSDINHLKNLSWYTTVPLLVCAWMFQDSQEIIPRIEGLIDLLAIIAQYFIKVVAGLVVVYLGWLISSIYIDVDWIPLTLIFATFLLTVAAVGFGVFLYKPIDMNLPINILWFASVGSIAFNLYQIEHSLGAAGDKNT